MSEFNISIPSGESKRLLTGGKYCPADIVVTAEGEEIVFVDCVTVRNDASRGFVNGFVPEIRLNQIKKIEARLKIVGDQHVWFSVMTPNGLSAEGPFINGITCTGFVFSEVTKNEIDSEGVTSFSANVSGPKESPVKIGSWNDSVYSKNTVFLSLAFYDESENPVCNLAPAVKNGLAGLYDTVSKKFYSNNKVWPSDSVVAGEVV